MRTRLVSLALLLALCAVSLVAQTGNDLLQRAGAKMDQGDIPGALQIYEKIIRDFPSDRPLRAKALMQQAACYKRQGQAKERDVYQRIINEFQQFPDQAAVVKTARSRLAALKSPPWSEHDYLLVAEFQNDTGDPKFDNALRWALQFELEPSPYVDVLPYGRVRDALRRLGRPEDERVAHAVARTICARVPGKGNLLPSITRSEVGYLLTLEVYACSDTGERIARVERRAAKLENILEELRQAVLNIRGQLGEPQESIARFAPRLITTKSFEALDLYGQAYKQHQVGILWDVQRKLDRALEIDPDFASAYALRATIGFNNDDDRRHARDAYRLRDRVSERERLHIEALYQSIVLGQVDKAIDTLERLRDLYPSDGDVRTFLGNQYRARGQFESGLEELEKAVKLNPQDSAARGDLTRNYMELGRYADAKKRYRESVIDGVDSADGMHRAIHALAVAEGDALGAQQQLEWLNVRGAQYQMILIGIQAQTALFRGDRKSARTSREDMVSRRNFITGSKSNTVVNEARAMALFGDSSAARALAESALQLAGVRWRSPRVLANALLASGFVSDETAVNRLAAEIGEKYPEDTFMNVVWIPAARAILDVQKGRGADALALLEPARAYEPAEHAWWAAYVRGLAYLQLKPGEAVAEFQKIIDHRSVDPLSVLYPASKMRIAEAYALMGDVARARASYQEFFTLWKDADPDVPILLEARAKFAALPQ